MQKTKAERYHSMYGMYRDVELHSDDKQKKGKNRVLSIGCSKLDNPASMSELQIVLLRILYSPVYIYTKDICINLFTICVHIL